MEKEIDRFFATSGFRVRLEESWYGEKEKEPRAEKYLYKELWGKFGIIYPWNATSLCVYFNSIKVAQKAPRSWKMTHNGDFERVYRIEFSDLPKAAELIRARRKRVLSPEQRAAAVERLRKLREKPPEEGTSWA